MNEEKMLIPRKTQLQKHVEGCQKVALLEKSGKVKERVYWSGSKAIVYRGVTNVLLRTHFTAGPIHSVFYHDFGTEERPRIHLVVCSEDELKMISLQTNECHSLSLPMKFEACFRCEEGLLLVRSRSDEENRGPATIYSITHPNGELLPVLCRFKDDDLVAQFSQKRLEFVSDFGKTKFLFGFDNQKGLNCLFAIRRCSDDEKRIARHDLSMAANRSFFPFSAGTSGIHSEYGTPNQSKDVSSSTPLGYSILKRLKTPGVAGSPIPFIPKTNEKPKLTENAVTMRMLSSFSNYNSYQQPLDYTSATSVLSAITGQPEVEFDENSVEFALECVWTDEAQKSVQAPRSPSRLPVMQSPQIPGSVLKRATKGRSKVDRDLIEQLNKDLHQSKKAKSAFLTTDFDKKTYLVISRANNVQVVEINPKTGTSLTKMTTLQGCQAFQIPGRELWIMATSTPIGLIMYSGMEKVADIATSFLLPDRPHHQLLRVVQLITRGGFDFEAIVEMTTTSSETPSEPMYKKPRSGFTSPRKRCLASEAHFSFGQVTQSPAKEGSDGQRRASTSQSTPESEFFQFRVLLEVEPTTNVANEFFNMILSNIESQERKIKFLRNWVIKNNFRITRSNMDVIMEIEAGLVFECLLETAGINPEEMPFMRLVNRRRDWLQHGRNTPFFDEKRSRTEEQTEELGDSLRRLLEYRRDHSDALEESAEIVIDQNPQDDLTPEDLARILKSIMEFLAYEKLNKDNSRLVRCVCEVGRVLSEVLGLPNFTDFFERHCPELRNTRFIAQFTMKADIDIPKIDPVVKLTEQMEQSLIIPEKRTEPGPFLSSSQRNKLRLLPTSEEIAKWERMRWPTDIRVSNVSTMLDSSKPVLIPDLRQGQNVAESQLREAQEKFLQNAAYRTITRAFGYALLHFQSQQSEAMETAVIEKVNLNGKLAPSNMKLEFPNPDNPQTKAAQKQMLEWANFYNGVSRGLSTILGADAERNKNVQEELMDHHFHLYGRPKANVLDADAEAFGRVQDEIQEFQRRDHLQRPNNEDDGPRVVDWEWVFHKIREDKECSPVLAGFLLAAGLSGQSMSVNPYDLHEFLSLYDKMVVVALLLGTSVAYRGTANVYMNKILYTHLPFLLQPTVCDFRIEPSIQTVSLLSLGYLFAESMHAQLTNDLINQMSKETFFETDPGSERYSYVLAAGLAVGLINLCKGDELAQLELPVQVSHLRIHERLLLLLNGGLRDLVIVSYQKDPCTLAQHGCCSCGMSRADQRYQPQLHQHHHRQRSDRVGDEGAGANGGTGSTSVSAASSHVAELRNVNVHLSAPAACAAFTLIYLRTNNKNIARKLGIPEELHQLGLIRPDIILLRTVAKCLVMYDSVGQTNEWIDSQIPPTLREYFKLTKKPAKRTEDLGMLARAYLYAKAGACFAMALKHPSTWNEKVTRTLKDAFDQLSNEPSYSFAFMLSKAGLNAVEACKNVIMSALAIVNAGSGDVSLIRAFRKCRNQNTNFLTAPKESHLFSTQVVSNMCIGMLFLGHGRYGLSMSNMSIASLYISFLPIYGHAIYDNRCYFQAFRFLWTLAIEPRFLVTVADGSHHAIEAKLEIKYKDENTPILHAHTPYLLPPLETISSLSLSAPGFEVLSLDLKKQEDQRTLIDVLQKLCGRLPLKKTTKQSGTYDFRNLPTTIVPGPDSDLHDLKLEDVLAQAEDDVIPFFVSPP
ncbi:unnamed protein product [Bursaphelenchus xylophilus]|uniref:(pine wood nematode) hypothetical protein n=1 Tax=Bursaphelenchus xylophilus TaxID=6326 RepID=A0A1I7S982_BURXY|nr:unnamed protein product [Bursaphelenchus xylophilus]CAG9100427.1 unnamed protein product [Bursaphelenchus xylophilus]